jgi:hypothetical protein
MIRPAREMSSRLNSSRTWELPWSPCSVGCRSRWTIRPNKPCGQPAFNTGYRDEAGALAKRYCEIFADADAIVSPSGSCTAMVRNFYPELLGKATQTTAQDDGPSTWLDKPIVGMS